MSENETTQQAVVENTEGQVTPAPEGTDARENDDLETLLSEYDHNQQNANSDGIAEQTRSATPKPDPISQEHSKESEVLKRLDAMEAERKAERDAERTSDDQRRFKADMATTVEAVRGDLDADYFDDNWIESWIDGQAKDDRRLAKAWVDRAQNPKQFQKIVGELGRRFTKKFSSFPDKQATEDKDAVAAAVQGASTKAPEDKPTNYVGMSDAEFSESIRKEHGFEPLI